MESRNPESNAIVQALLDCKDHGYGTLTVDQLLSTLGRDKDTARDLHQKYESRGYNEEKLNYTQVSKNPMILQLDPVATKILLTLATYSTQDGYISVKHAVVSRITGLSERTIRSAIKTLTEAGLLVTVAGSSRHEPAILQVNPNAMYSGKRKHMTKDNRDFNARLQNQCILNQELDYEIRKDLITRKLTNGTQVRFSRIDLNMKKEPADRNSTDSPQNSPTENHTLDHQDLSSKQLQGQTSFADIPGVLPGAQPGEENLPF